MNIFLVFGATMSALAGITLVFPHSSLTAIWKLNPTAYAQMAPWGILAGIPMLLVSVAMACAALGWYCRRRWGWTLAVIIIATQIVGDTANVVAGRLLEGLTGVVIAGALLWWLLRSEVRSSFAF
jgi:uncharacterized membrane protein YccC